MCTVLDKGFYTFLLYFEYYFYFHKVIIHIYDTNLKKKEKVNFSPVYIMLLLSCFLKIIY